MSARDDFELVAELAFPLPVTVIGELIGIPEPDRWRFRDWSRDILAVVAAGVPAPADMEVANQGDARQRGVPA